MMNDPTIQSELCALVSSILGRPVTRETSRANEPAWDSLKHMEIIFAVESKWSVIFSEDEMVAVSSLADLQRKVELPDVP
jgi:acyl carrier protein